MTGDATAGKARIDADAHARAGVYADSVDVVLGEREVTFDFLRVDYADGTGLRAVLVARAAMAIETVLDIEHTLNRMAPLWQNHVGPVP